MTLRRTGIRRSGGPRRHKGLRQRSRKQARRDRQFRAVKLLILERDGYGCRKCGCIYTNDEYGAAWLDPHHLLPRGRGGSDEPENLVTLCRYCHWWVHNEPGAAYEQGWLVRSGGGA